MSISKMEVHLFAAGGDEMEDGGVFARVKGVHQSTYNESWDGGRPYYEMKTYRNGRLSKELANEIKQHLLNFFETNPGQITCPVTLQTQEVIAKKMPIRVVVGWEPKKAA